MPPSAYLFGFLRRSNRLSEEGLLVAGGWLVFATAGALVLVTPGWLRDKMPRPCSRPPVLSFRPGILLPNFSNRVPASAVLSICAFGVPKVPATLRKLGSFISFPVCAVPGDTRR